MLDRIGIGVWFGLEPKVGTEGRGRVIRAIRAIKMVNVVRRFIR